MLTLHCSAKVNLMLAVTGQRPDGFHNIVSVVAQVGVSDVLSAAVVPEGSQDQLECLGSDLPVDASNLVLKAANAFRRKVTPAGAFAFRLEKRLPVGAGLGGGSSNAVSALHLMNDLSGKPLSLADLTVLAAEIGSDCPLFVTPEPKVIRGRGEQIESLHASVSEQLRGRPVLLFKPAFGISTPWAYQTMREAAGRFYTPAADAEARLSDWLAAPHTAMGRLLHNDFEAAVGSKYVLLPALLEHLRQTFGLPCLLSGSGSACFALPDERHDASEIEAVIRNWIGHEGWVSLTAFA